MSIESAAGLAGMQRVGRGDSETWQHVGFFFVLTAVFSAIFWLVISETGRLGAGNGLYITGLQWSPGLAGLVTRYRYERTLKNHGWKWPPTKVQLLSYAIPIAYLACVYGLAWTTGLGGFYDASFLATQKIAFGWSGLPDAIALMLYVLVVGTVGMIPSCATALGEELGWRGFLVPELAKVTGFANVALISGIGWALWHYPLFLFADYNAGTPKPFAMACFTITVVGLSFLYAWLRLASDSLWTGMLLHGSHNLFLESIFDPLTINTGKTRFVTGDFGIGLAGAAVIVACLCWRRRDQLPGRSGVPRTSVVVPDS